MWKVQHGLIAMALTLPVTCAAAASPFVDRPVTLHSKSNLGHDVTLTVPYVVGGNPTAARRINTFIRDGLLETLPDASADHKGIRRLIDIGSPLETAHSQGLRQLNGGRMVAASVLAEGCGSSCTGTTSTWRFDARNGRLILPQEMLSPEARAAIGQHLATLTVQRARRELARVKHDIAHFDPKKFLTLDEIHTQADIYEDCLRGALGKGGDEGLGPMDVGDGSLTFRYGCSAGHSVQALNDLANLPYTLRGAQLRPYLTDYGKYMLLGEGTGAVSAINPYAQYFSGTINGTIPVTLYLGSDDAGRSGGPLAVAYYYYDNYRKRIPLSLQRTGNHFVLTEGDDQEIAKGVLRFDLKGDMNRHEFPRHSRAA